MNTNGILLYTRANYTAASTAAQPNMFAIQIGKGMKGVTSLAYFGTGKTTPFSIQKTFTGGIDSGSYEYYDEKSGILIHNAGMAPNGGTTPLYLGFDATNIVSRSSGYIVINASKNPSLAGMSVPNPVRVRAVQSSGQSIATSTTTTLIFDTAETFDTHGAFTPSTGTFVAPENGYYQVNCSILYTNAAWAASNVIALYLNKNGVGYANSEAHQDAAHTAYEGATLNDLVYLKAGDTLTTATWHNRGTATALITSGLYNVLTITKV
jgi:hypothetical protein